MLDYVEKLFYSCHKVSSQGSGPYIESPGWTTLHHKKILIWKEEIIIFKFLLKETNGSESNFQNIRKMGINLNKKVKLVVNIMK